MQKEWHKKPARIRPKPLSRRWMKIANRRPAQKGKAVKASRLLEARETRANSAKDALQKILKKEVISPILPRVMVEKAIFPREKANPVANSRDIPRERALLRARGPPRAQKVDEGKDHLVSGTLIQVVVHQCTKLLVPTRIIMIMCRRRVRMPTMKKGILAKKVSETSGRTRTVPGKPCSRSTREIIRNKGAKIVRPSHTQSGVFLNIRSWTLERCL